MKKMDKTLVTWDCGSACVLLISRLWKICNGTPSLFNNYTLACIQYFIQLFYFPATI